MTTQQITRSNLYLYVAAIIFGIPMLCGCLIIMATYWDAHHNVEVWRGEFQTAIDAQCPKQAVDILGGRGRVYLQAYQLDYQWIYGEISCTSNGRLIQCSCRAEQGEYTSVSKYLE